MFNFGDVLDLPLIWGGLVALSVFIYVLLDGFDLGCGILFPFAGSDKNRSRIMNSIAPFGTVTRRGSYLVVAVYLLHSLSLMALL